MRVVDQRSTRADPGRATFATAILALAWLAAVLSQSRTTPTPTDRVTWRPYEQARALAGEGQGQRPLLLFFSDDGDLSRRLEREIFGDRKLAAQIESRYVLSRIADRSALGEANSPEVESRLRLYGCGELPCLVVVAADGSARTFQRYPGTGRASAFLLAVR